MSAMSKTIPIGPSADSIETQGQVAPEIKDQAVQHAETDEICIKQQSRSSYSGG